MTTGTEIPRCSDCGMAPEFVWRGNSPAVRFAALKCPNNHQRVETTYHDGSQATAKKDLITAWENKIAQQMRQEGES